MLPTPLSKLLRYNCYTLLPPHSEGVCHLPPLLPPAEVGELSLLAGKKLSRYCTYRTNCSRTLNLQELSVNNEGRNENHFIC